MFSIIDIEVFVLANPISSRTGSPFLAFNTHLDHMSQEARLEGLKLILSRITTLSMGLPVFLLGDFNSPPREGLVDKVTQNNAKQLWGKFRI